MASATIRFITFGVASKTDVKTSIILGLKITVGRALQCAVSGKTILINFEEFDLMSLVKSETAMFGCIPTKICAWLGIIYIANIFWPLFSIIPLIYFSNSSLFFEEIRLSLPLTAKTIWIINCE